MEHEDVAASFYRRASSPDGYDWRCKECGRSRSRERMRRLRAEDPERVRAAKKRSYQRNRERVCAKVREDYAENREARVAQKKEYNARNAERRAEKQRERYAENDGAAYARQRRERDREHAREIQRRWRERNPDKARAYDHAKRARRMAAEGRYTEADLGRIRAEQEGRCFWCGRDLSETGFHADHVVPLSRGGTNWPDNICLACPPCNLRKWALMPDEWKERIGATSGN